MWVGGSACEILPYEGPLHLALLDEPGDGGMVFGRKAEHQSGNFFRRDDREGHGDPIAAPRRWWCSDLHRWMSWPEIQRWAQRAGLVLLELRPVGGPLTTDQVERVARQLHRDLFMDGTPQVNVDGDWYARADTEREQLRRRARRLLKAAGPLPEPVT